MHREAKDVSGKPDWRPRSRKRNKHILRRLHLEREGCALCGEQPVQLHHVLSRAQGGDDNVYNIVKLCVECHCLITDNDVEKRMELGLHLLRERLDVIDYVRERLGDIPGYAWLERRLFIEL
jgi:hypothetical protein